jgi:excisionase family DNA binding protein
MAHLMATAPTRADVSVGDFQTPSAVGALLSVDQVAERLGTPTRFVRRLIAQRRIGFCRIGRYIRITDSDVAAFIEAGRVPPAPGSRTP